LWITLLHTRTFKDYPSKTGVFSPGFIGWKLFVFVIRFILPLNLVSGVFLAHPLFCARPLKNRN